MNRIANELLVEHIPLYGLQFSRRLSDCSPTGSIALRNVVDFVPRWGSQDDALDLCSAETDMFHKFAQQARADAASLAPVASVRM